MIDQYKPVIDILYREDNSYWKMIPFIGLDKSIYISSLDLEIPMKAIYNNAIQLAEPKF